MNNQSIGYKLQKNEICNYEIINGDYPENERFKCWVESIFETQDRFAEKVGYSRKAINEFCLGKKPIPKCLLILMELSEENALLKQGIIQKRRFSKKNLPEKLACK